MMGHIKEQGEQLERELGVFVYYHRNVSTNNSTTYTCVLPEGVVKPLQQNASESLLITTKQWMSQYSYFANMKKNRTSPSNTSPSVSTTGSPAYSPSTSSSQVSSASNSPAELPIFDPSTTSTPY